MSIVKLWILADRRDIPLLMNETVDSFQQTVIELWWLPMFTITEIYNNTTEEACLRRMIVDMYVSIARASTVANITYDSDIYSQHFLADLVKRLFENNARQLPLNKEQYGKVDMCPSFHVHEEGVSCTKKGTKRSSGVTEEEG